MRALILAAGYATRLYPLNQRLPKALLPLGRETVMGHIISLVNEVPDCEEIIVVSNHKFIDHFRRWKEGYEGYIPVTLLDDGTDDVTESLGAIGDIHYTINKMQLDEELLIIAGDSYFDFSLSLFVETCRESGQDGVCVKKIDDPALLSHLGIVLLDENRNIVNIEEKPAKPKSDLAMYAIYYYTRETIRLFAQYRKEKNNMDAPGNFVVWLYTRKPMTTFTIEGQCHDVGTVEAYTKLCESLGITYDLSGIESGDV
ncbi:MAG: nucleotidyltransferase family protein [Clostridiales bacterium]|nr:nucleotidyltransferase family protein [Clostridiales bacterium]